MAAKKILYKSRDNKMLSGIFGGLGEYSGIDATLLRLGWVLVTVTTGLIPGVIGYIVAAVIVPEKPSKK